MPEDLAAETKFVSPRSSSSKEKRNSFRKSDGIRDRYEAVRIDGAKSASYMCTPALPSSRQILCPREMFCY